jgi:uncharacterized protein
LIPHDQNLSSEEMVELERFLASPPLGETSLDLFELEGFFAAILLAPKMTMPSRWLKWVWDSREGKAEPDFASFEEAQRKFHLLMSFYNMVASHLATDPEVYEPRLDLVGSEEAQAWRQGFAVGMRFDSDSWAELAAAKPEWLEPILSLGEPSGGISKKGATERKWSREVGRSVAKIHDHWLVQRLRGPTGTTRGDSSYGREAGSPRYDSGPPIYPPPRSAVKVGRNELCPCGSGKKYKRCCGANRP